VGQGPGGKAVGELLERAYRDFDSEDPAGIVPRLLEARAALVALPAGRWTTAKRADLDEVIAACLGLYLEAVADSFAAVPGGWRRSTSRRPTGRRGGAPEEGDDPVAGVDVPWEQELDGHHAFKKQIEVTLPAYLADSQPYWLRERGTLGMFRVDDPALIGLPENPPRLTASFALEAAGTPIALERPVVFKRPTRCWGAVPAVRGDPAGSP